MNVEAVAAVGPRFEPPWRGFVPLGHDARLHLRLFTSKDIVRTALTVCDDAYVEKKKSQRADGGLNLTSDKNNRHERGMCGGLAFHYPVAPGLKQLVRE